TPVRAAWPGSSKPSAASWAAAAGLLLRSCPDLAREPVSLSRAPQPAGGGSARVDCLPSEAAEHNSWYEPTAREASPPTALHLRPPDSPPPRFRFQTPLASAP